MRKKTAHQAPKIFAWSSENCISAAKFMSPAKKNMPEAFFHVLVFGHRAKDKEVLSNLGSRVPPAQLEYVKEKRAGLLYGSSGMIYFTHLLVPAKDKRTDIFSKHEASIARDAAGLLWAQLRENRKLIGEKPVTIEYIKTSDVEEEGFWYGLGLANYSFKALNSSQAESEHFNISALGGRAQNHARGCQLAAATNLARHLTNTPPNVLNPVAFADSMRDLFKGQSGVTVDIWDEVRLKKEKMHLLLAVGGASSNPPRLVVLRWRPKGAPAKSPIALVGKGITFDSGGLDIKPSSGMRLMKKDMGGAAAVAGVFYWLTQSGLKVPVDCYLSLAENSVGSQAFRPSDIIETRSGVKIEIHNTDAEGRLVLADAISVALEAKPRALVNLATLTGAIKVALGAEIAGLFSNDEVLSRQLLEAGRRVGDLAWRMPLYPPYKAQLKSNFADYTNCSDGFGGAITAGLFLELFAQEVPWAHLDIYAWKDSGGGAWTEPGGSGQGVAMITSWLDGLKK